MSVSSDGPLVKPFPSLSLDVSSETLEPYHDEPSPNVPPPAPAIASLSPQPQTSSTPRLQHPEIQLFFAPYSDAPRITTDEDVPLAHLFPYPTEAPPPYHFAVRESYRGTLVQHIASQHTSTVRDEEAVIDREQSDDVRFAVEKVVAAIIVAMLLLVIASILALIAVSGFNWRI